MTLITKRWFEGGKKQLGGGWEDTRKDRECWDG